ncbi:hypothetical protein [Flavobacterium pectinovorum]|uniref:hypothetical protein n=1 Tax=Flavobacterium pectinovorum TaxID=29533 RepID=UPI0013761766|nr:hypothetical protein [Flavobacterium pectinovorum]
MNYDDPADNDNNSSQGGSEDSTRYIPSTDSSQRSIIEKGGNSSGEPLEKK